jgi:predicted O-methyltransferase YrrM
MIVVAHALARGRIADPAQRDQETTAVRETLRAVRLDDTEVSTLLPVGDGLLVAICS